MLLQTPQDGAMQCVVVKQQLGMVGRQCSICPCSACLHMCARSPCKCPPSLLPPSHPQVGAGLSQLAADMVVRGGYTRVVSTDISPVAVSLGREAAAGVTGLAYQLSDVT